MKQYWNERYKSGRGSNSYHLREWEMSIILRHTNNRLTDVLDVGCGDLFLWGGRLPFLYLGIDISEEVIQKNRELYPSGAFDCVDMTEPNLYGAISAPVILCLNVLYHIMSVKGFRTVLNNLNKWTDRLLFISHWNHDPKDYDKSYQNYIPLREHLDALPDLEMIEESVFLEKDLLSMYVFRRKEQ